MIASSVAGQRLLAASVLAVVTASVVDVKAQDQAQTQAKAEGESRLGWSNTSDLSLVVVAGNSQSTTFGLSDKLQHVSKAARLEFEINVVRANKSDDRFFLVEPGLEFPVGGAPSNPATSLIKPNPEPDIANYLIRGGYEKQISARWFWNAGASWYRNDDAGILNRYIGFAGLGNTWADNPRRRFVTSYGVSYTDREEEKPDTECLDGLDERPGLAQSQPPMAVRERARPRGRPGRHCLCRRGEPGRHPGLRRRTFSNSFVGRHEARARLGGRAKRQAGHSRSDRPRHQVLNERGQSPFPATDC